MGGKTIEVEIIYNPITWREPLFMVYNYSRIFANVFTCLLF